jgi:hypothetical protein
VPRHDDSVPSGSIARVLAAAGGFLVVVGLAGACSTSDESSLQQTIPTPTSHTDSTATSAPDADRSTPVKTSTADLISSPAPTTPTAGTAVTINEPADSRRSEFLKAIRPYHLALDEDAALSLGTSICGISRSAGVDGAVDYAAPMIQAATGTQPPRSAVVGLVTSSKGLC